MKCLALLSILLLVVLLQPFSTFAAVVVTDSTNSVTLDNGIVSAQFRKHDIVITSLKKGSLDVLAGSAWGGAVDINWDGNHGSPLSGATYQLVSSEADYAEIKFRRVADGSFPFTVELHYAMHSGDSGLYCFETFENDGSTPGSYIEQSRFLLLLSPSYDYYHSVTDELQDAIPSAAELNNPLEVLWNGAVRLQDGTYYYKYQYNVSERYHRVHGAIGDTGSGYFGVYIASASNEYLNSGPAKQNLTTHAAYTVDSPVVQKLFQSAHYGNGMFQLDDQPWSKMYGPFFIYLNEGVSRSALWDDAKAIAAAEVAKWPYDWMDHPMYPLAAGRGTVTGQLDITDGNDPNGACVLLAQPPQPNWQQQARDYMFWADADETGVFTIPNARPNDYTLYAFVDGVLGEFRHDGVSVQAGSTTDLGTMEWTPVKRRLLWQLGTPDRTAAEYFRGDEYRGVVTWQKYTDDFPSDIHFVIGTSDEATDWNYVHPAQSAGGGTPSWNIEFDLPGNLPICDQAILTIALASAAYGGSLEVEVNGTLVFDSTLEPYDGAALQCAIFGYYREEIITFDPALLNTGTNTITLTQASSYEFASVMYDCLRLELALSADLNTDGHVNFLDWAILADEWQKCTDPNNPICEVLGQ